MAIELNIRTSKTVSDIISIFKNFDTISILGEFDSLNYGDGYDLVVRNVSCRLYDDSKTFGLKTSDSKNKGLIIEIDRHDKHDKADQQIVSRILKQVVENAGYMVF